MTLGIMQPYFLPYLGYFSLIKHTDKWIIFDPVQYIRHGWIERNRILKPAEGWQYIAIPLQKHNRETLIKDIKIREEDWRTKILNQLAHYKKAPYYQSTIQVLTEGFTIKTDSITLMNAHILKCICQYLHINFNYEVFSEMNLNIDPVKNAGDWALNISKAYGANTYINPPGGVDIFDKDAFKKSGIALKFLSINLTPYHQHRKTFEPGLSIIDVMMFNSVDEINNMLDNYQIINA
ncbi:MAG: glycine transferase [Sphingobacteriaceae bacterium]|nr:MAG: glycine transferase [Sphingobacteriaceae bacterium]